MVLEEALEKGMITEEVLDGHLRRTLYGRFELGMFDPADMIPWKNLGEDVISSESNHQLAVQAARESMVLLDNDGILPLAKNLKKIAVVGPNANDAGLLNGNYGGTPTKEHTFTLLQGIREAVPGTEVYYSQACPLMEGHETISYLKDFNDGKGVYVEFFNNNELEGTPDVTGYYDRLNFSTFGAWGFAEGISTDKISVRATGKFTAPFTGEMKYAISSDNGYVLKINGQVYEESKAASRRGFGRRGGVEYKSFNIVKGETYDIAIEYKRGTGNFAMLNAEICERRLIQFDQLAADVADADAIIVIGGISARLEGEGGDKADIELPEVQQRLIRAMKATGKPVVVVNCSGSAIAFGSIKDQYNALLQAWYPGQGGSQALAEVIFGDYNPGGKLPVTFYESTNDLPDFLDYSMENRTYRYFRGVPQYAFGYGLSYTTFEVGKGKISKKSMKTDGSVKITVPVENTGDREGTETIQVYVKALDYAEAPIKDLRGFAKVNLKPGETAKAEIVLNGESFQYYDPSIDELSTRPGRYQILYGTSSLEKDLKTIDFVVK